VQHAWLNPALDGPAARSLCEPLTADRLSVAPANPRMNKAGLEDEGPDLLVAALDA
jgi:putative SOS response-associated peptidase YedK